MFENINSIQQIADRFKAVALAADSVPNEMRLHILQTISRFEQFGWQPQVMLQAVQEAAPDVRTSADGVQLPKNSAGALDSIEAIISRYVELYGYDPRAEQKLYTMRQAADYLGIKQSVMETYALQRGAIAGEKIGRAWVFTHQSLDDFQQRRTTDGSPASN